MTTKAVMVPRGYIKAERKSKRKHHRKSFTLPLAAIAGFAPLTRRIWSGYQTEGFNGALHNLSLGTIGYNIKTGKFDLSETIGSLTPIVAGILIHKFIGGKLGVNRMLARAGVPVIRL